MLNDESTKIALTLMGEFIAEGLIEEAGGDRWQLTPKGEAEANRIMEKLLDRERALALLLADHIIRKGMPD